MIYIIKKSFVFINTINVCKLKSNNSLEFDINYKYYINIKKMSERSRLIYFLLNFRSN